MNIITDVREMQEICKQRNQAVKTGFVPTMGFLHEGHLSLVEESCRTSDVTIVSIYVNPSQFGANEDFGAYPRDYDRDLRLLAEHNVDYVFMPDSAQMYPQGHKSWVEMEGLSDILCGSSRPGHFRGVATIVLKLVNIVQPHLMFMGIKDFQQVVILETMLKDLNQGTKIVRCPILREPDGLAMSSRNCYLDIKERISAICLYGSIGQAQSLYQSGTRDRETILAAAKQIIFSADGKIDYIKLVDQNTLSEVETADENTRIMLAVYIGKTRLIDNDALSA
ncbi:MAG: pantoate--beta-alanine ligase [Candidatus Cloacimonadaceae bacterium]|nr:pantoate--beta-alanine ligase [Candidatus Cloacimonadaceae bacterium]